MNKNLNLCEILKDCPKGTKLYTPIIGEVIFQRTEELTSYKIIVCPPDDLDDIYYFTKEGKYYDTKGGECLLFPSKDQRDWSEWKCLKPKFNPSTLKPFDKVLTREFDRDIWYCGIFSHMFQGKICRTIDHIVHECCIPYNDDTKHLVGTSEEAPEYYRYWEE